MAAMVPTQYGSAQGTAIFQALAPDSGAYTYLIDNRDPAASLNIYTDALGAHLVKTMAPVSFYEQVVPERGDPLLNGIWLQFSTVAASTDTVSFTGVF